MSGFQDHFAPQAPHYATFRPRYTPELIAAVAALVSGCDRCWDVGTGSGQAAILLAEHFAHVEATDASASQIAHATPHPRVTYRVSRAEHASLADASVDLVTVAQALHWFDLPAFYREVARVTVDGGALAAWSYGMLEVEPKIDAVVWWFYEERLGRYWPEERRHVEAGYSTLAFPFERLALHVPALEVPLDRDGLTGFISTWSALKRAREQEGADPLLEFIERLDPAWPTARETRLVRWPMVLLAGRVHPTR